MLFGTFSIVGYENARVIPIAESAHCRLQSLVELFCVGNLISLVYITVVVIMHTLGYIY